MTEFAGFGEAAGRGEGRGLTLLVLDRFAIEAMFLPAGEVWNWARDLGREVQRNAEELLIAAGGVDTGRLLESIGYSTVPVAQSVQINVRAGTRHALYYIKGTLPHIEQVKRTIVYAGDPPPRTGKKAGDTDIGFMKFFWLRTGKIRYEQQVFHPGWHGYNFLDEAKTEVLIRRGII